MTDTELLAEAQAVLARIEAEIAGYRALHSTLEDLTAGAVLHCWMCGNVAPCIRKDGGPMCRECRAAA